MDRGASTKQDIANSQAPSSRHSRAYGFGTQRSSQKALFCSCTGRGPECGGLVQLSSQQHCSPSIVADKILRIGFFQLGFASLKRSIASSYHRKLYSQQIQPKGLYSLRGKILVCPVIYRLDRTHGEQESGLPDVDILGRDDVAQSRSGQSSAEPCRVLGRICPPYLGIGGRLHRWLG